MEIGIEKSGEVVILRCSGSLDADTVALFKKRTAELFEGGTIKFVVDFSKTAFVDSMGLGAMISLLRRVREKKGDVKVAGLNKDFQQIFEITRLGRLFEVCDNAGDACKKF